MPVPPRRTLRRFGVSLILAAVATVTTAIAVSAYVPPGSVGSVTASCASTSSGGTCSVGFKFKDANGNPICNAPVNFTVTGVTGATVTPTSGTTDCNGNVGAVLAANTSGCGTATITANAGNASAQTTVTVPCSGSGSLPNTSTAPPSSPAWLVGISALALLMVGGSALALRRTRATA